MSEVNIPLTVVDNNQVVGMEAGAGVINAVSPTVDLERVTTPNPGVKITVKDVRGEHSETVQDGSAGDPSALIDDTTPASNKVFSSEKVDTELNTVMNAINGLEKGKAKGIVKQIAMEKDTIHDSDASAVITPVVYGKTHQEKVFEYNIVDYEKNSTWRNNSSSVASMTVNDETGEVDIEVTAATDKVQFQQTKSWKFTEQEIAEIKEHSVYTISYIIDTSITSNYDLRPHLEWKKNGTIKTNESTNLANGTGTKERSLSTIISNGFDELNIWWEIKKTGGNTLVQGDYFKLKKFEIKLNTSANKYKIVNTADPTIVVGETEAEVPYVLRGVPSDEGNVEVDGTRFLCDYLNTETGKLVRWISSQIDSCVNNPVEYSDYILEEPTEESVSAAVCERIKALRTEYPETEVDADGGFISFGYLVDTKTYIDRSSGQGFVTPEQYGAKGDGETDDTEAIQAMFSSGAEVIKLSDNKNYMVSKEIIIAGLDEITIFGNGSTIKRIAGNLSEVNNDEYVLSTDMTSVGRKSITIQNLHVCANAKEYTDDVNSYGFNILPGLRVYGYDTVRLDGVEISDTLTGRGYLIGQAVHGIVENCYVHDIGQPDNVKIIFPNYSCGGGTFIIKDGSYVGSTFSVKNSRFERITASVHGSRSQYMEVMGNTYIECQDVIVEQTDTNPDDAVSVNKHRLIKNNHLIRCAHSLFSCSCAMSADNDTTGKTVVIDGNVIEDAGDVEFYDLTSNPRTHSRVAVRMLALINDNNNIKAPYQKVVIKNNYIAFADNLVSEGICNVYGDSVEFSENTIISPADAKATIGAINADAIIIVRNNTVDAGIINLVGIWNCAEITDNVFVKDGIKRDSRLIATTAQNLIELRRNKLLKDTAVMANLTIDQTKLRAVGNTAKNLITSDIANCRGSGIVVDNVADNEFVDTTNTGSYTVSGTIAYTMT